MLTFAVSWLRGFGRLAAGVRVRTVFWSLCFLGSFGTLGCGPGNLKPSELTPRELQVQVFEKGKLPSCTLYEELGIIEVESGSSFTPGTFESSLAKLRRIAAERNATGLLLISHSNDGKIDKASATAMRCLARS
jgi:hypothetical protein